MADKVSRVNISLMGFKGEKYFNWFYPVFVVLLIGGLIVVKWLH